MKRIEYIVEYDSIIKDYIKEKESRKFLRHLKALDVEYKLNGNMVRSHIEIKKGDHLELIYKDDVIRDNNFYDYPLDIVYDCPEYMILNKPRGLKTIPTGYNDFKSLYNAILFYYKKNNISNTIHFINRLDKDTEGLLIVAKDKRSAHTMSSMLKEINKYYLALCEGIIDKDGIISAPIKRGVGIKREIGKDGKEAKTYYKVLKHIGNNTLLELKLDSGRCHQIRLHLSSIGHPIVGDVLYGIKGDLHLTSYKLEFKCPFSGKNISYSVKPWFGDLL